MHWLSKTHVKKHNISEFSADIASFISQDLDNQIEMPRVRCGAQLIPLVDQVTMNEILQLI